MNSSIVNARVPLAKKEASAGILKQLGATPSDLINSAYDYVIAEKKLPQAHPAGHGAGLASTDALSTAPSAEEARAADASRFADFVGESTLDISWPEGNSCDCHASNDEEGAA